MAGARRPGELEREQRADRRGGWDHLAARQAGVLHDLLERQPREQRHEQEQPADVGAKLAGAQVQGPHVGRGSRCDPHTRCSLLIGAARQPREPLRGQDRPDRRWRDRLAVRAQGGGDVVDRQVLLAHRHDPVAQSTGLGRRLLPRRRAGALGQKELPGRVGAEVVAEHSEAARRVAEARGHLFGGRLVDEEGPQRLVLAVGGVGRLEEHPLQFC